MSVTKNYLYNVLLIISNTIFPIITFPYVSRILMPEYLGRVYFVQGVVAYFLLLAVLGAPNYGIKELSKAKSVGDLEEFKKIYTELLFMTILSSIISFTSLLFLVDLYDKFTNERILFYIFGIQVLFECFHINYFFVVMEDHKRRLIRSFAIRVVSLFFLFTFVKKPEDYYLYALLIVIPEVLARIIDVVSMKKYMWFKIKELNFRRHIKSMSIIFLYLFTIGIYGSIDTTMLGIMVGDEEVGLYSAAVKMYKMVLPVILTLGVVLSPRIIGAIKKKELNNVFKNLDIFVDYNFIVGIPATVLMVLLSKEFTLLFSGEKFEGAITTMQIMSPCLFFLALGSFIGGQILLPNNLEKTILKISIFGVILNVGLNYFMIPIYLRNGAALATLVTEVIIALMKIRKTKKIYPEYNFLNFDRIKIIIVNIFVSTLIVLIFNKMELNNMGKLFLIPSIYGVIYFIFLGILKVRRIIEWKKILFSKLKIRMGG